MPGVRGLFFVPQTVPLIPAPLNTLSPDVLNTWCTDRKRERESNLSDIRRSERQTKEEFLKKAVINARKSFVYSGVDKPKTLGTCNQLYCMADRREAPAVNKHTQTLFNQERCPRTY